MKLFSTVWSVVSLLALLALPATAQTDREHIEHTLDQIHVQASKADFDAYFDLYTDNAVFIGTDATERWPIEEFKGYAGPLFAQGRGWTYTVLERHVVLAPGGDVAWFDERLDNNNLGETRGSGVLLRTESGWKVAQYNLTIPIPNELSRQVVGLIRALEN